MRYHHLVVDAEGDSHWREVELALAERSFAPPARNIELSDPEEARALVFLRLRAGWDEPAHPSPAPQVLAVLAGAIRVTASDGTARDIGPGDIWRMEDLHGRGHHTKVVGGEDFEAMVVQLG